MMTITNVTIHQQNQVINGDHLYDVSTLHLTVYPLDASPYTRNLQMAFD